MSEEYIIGARVDEFGQDQDIFKSQDLFSKSWDELRNLSGIDKNFRRRSDRMAKAYDVAIPNDVDTTSSIYLDSAFAIPSGKNGAASKEINPGTVFRNGYGLFDVITPPWNLYELANYYDTSFANHAAIDAKVENIVGLGYDLHMTDRTLMKLEALEDEPRDRARKRIERAKVELKDWIEGLNDEESFTLSLIHI